MNLPFIVSKGVGVKLHHPGFETNPGFNTISHRVETVYYINTFHTLIRALRGVWPSGQLLVLLIQKKRGNRCADHLISVK